METDIMREENSVVLVISNRQLKWFTIGGTISSIIVAVLGLLSYLPGLRFLGSVKEDYIPMAPSTAISFILLASIILILPSIRSQALGTKLAFIIAFLVALFGFLEVLGYFLGLDLNFEDRFIPSDETLGSIPVGRMSPSTGLVFFIAGLAVIGLILMTSKNWLTTQIRSRCGMMGVLTTFIALIFVLAYIYGTPLMYDQGSTVPMAITTALGFFFLGISITSSSNKNTFPLRLLKKSDTPAQLLITFLPISIMAVILGSFVTLIAPQLSSVNNAFIAAILVVLITIITSMAVNWVSLRVGESIDRAEEELNQTLRNLDQKVNERTKELRIINQELSEFTFSVTHDLRAPLRAMQGFSSALIEDYQGVLDKTGRELADRIKKSAEKMDNMIQDLLIHSKISQKDAKLTNINLEKYINNANEVNKDIITQKNIVIDTNLPIKYVRGSKMIVEQVINNLISNAINFTDKNRSPRIKICSQLREDMVRLSIEDNGIGIEEQYFEKIFEVFERLHGEKNYPGTGIGLAIVKRGIEKMGGKFGVESKIGEFSRFWIELPQGENI